jgi:hypothetical protein
MRAEWVSLGPKKQKTSVVTLWTARALFLLFCYGLVKLVDFNEDWFLSTLIVLLLLLFFYVFGVEQSILFNRFSQKILITKTWFGWCIQKRNEMPLEDFSYIYLRLYGHDLTMYQVTLFSVKHPEVGLRTYISEDDAVVEAERLSKVLGIANRGRVTFAGGFSLPDE